MLVSSLPFLAAALPLAFGAPYPQEGSEVCDIVYVEASSAVGGTTTLANPVHAGVTQPATVVEGTGEPAVTEPAVTSPPATVASQASSNVDDSVKSQFAASTTWDFSVQTALPEGLRVSTDFIDISDKEPFTHTFKTENVAFEDGFAVLTVPGGQTGPDISSAEFHTTFDLKYGSIRTWAILTEEPGVCNGMFLWESDQQETDIEFISDPDSRSNINANNGTRALQYTNQALVKGDKSSIVYGMAPDDATSAVHEYRLDWFADRTDFYLDGDFHHSLTTNVPNVAGPWVWNNWGNGDPGWTADPPVNDALFKIQKIEIYYDPA